MSTTETFDDEDEAMTTAEQRVALAEANDRFIAAMAKATRRGRERATFGITVDRSPPVNARRIRAAAVTSYMSSPAALCEELGIKKRG